MQAIHVNKGFWFFVFVCFFLKNEIKERGESSCGSPVGGIRSLGALGDSGISSFSIFASQLPWGEQLAGPIFPTLISSLSKNPKVTGPRNHDRDFGNSEPPVNLVFLRDDCLRHSVTATESWLMGVEGKDMDVGYEQYRGPYMKAFISSHDNCPRVTTAAMKHHDEK